MNKDELINNIVELKSKFHNIHKAFDLEKLQQEIDALEAQTLEPDFWNDSETAQKISQELADKKQLLNKINKLQLGLNDLEVLFELHTQENPDDFSDVEQEYFALNNKIEDLEIDTLLNGEYDARNSIWTIRAGEGGTEAADWAKMLFRMYERYLTKNGYTIKTLDTSLDERGGIKSKVFQVSGPFAYGKFKNEAGTHRLVRISPFDSNKRRHTSFAGVEIIPEIKDNDEIEIPDDELKIDIFRSSGPGGQGVNTTDSAVRITHLPTGIVISMQNERSQIQNKNTAMGILKAKLLKLQQDATAKEKKDLAGDIKQTWGDQIRNYVLNPFQLVKDTRTKVETADAAGVLDGNLDQFIKAEIKL